MIIVHETFVCKPGNASKIAKMFKEFMDKDKHMMHVLTDVTGQWHRVIMVSQFESLSDYERVMEEYKNPSPEMQEAMKSMGNINEMYVSGSREIYKTW